MTLWSMIVWIVGISILGGIIMQYLKGKENGADAAGMRDEFLSKKELQPYLERIDQLEERIRVLERIATDKGRKLSDEIDNL